MQQPSFAAGADELSHILDSRSRLDQIAMCLEWSWAIMILSTANFGIYRTATIALSGRRPASRASALWRRVRMKFVGMSAKRHSKPRLYLIEAVPPTIGPRAQHDHAWHPVYQWGQNIISRMV